MQKKIPLPNKPKACFERLRLFYLLGVLCVLAVHPGVFATQSTGAQSFPPIVYPERFKISKADDGFLEDLSRRSFQYFIDQANPENGLVLDRARSDGSPFPDSHASKKIASSAASGFGLTALCIGVERGWISNQEARERVRATLRFFANQAFNEKGWFYHWLDLQTGERRWQSEISTIDTALLLGGMLTARQKFKTDAEIVRLATLIYERIDFPYMQNRRLTLTMGSKPESGFLASRWDQFSEHLMLDLLAIGSPTHPSDPRMWYAWRRDWITFAGYTYITGAPLFVQQYSHAWVDFRDRRENVLPHVDYFANSIAATRAHREFCISLRKLGFTSYSENLWGITASDSAKGYIAWGGPPLDPATDGTIVPCAAGGSLMFAPDICIAALKEMKEKYGDKVYGKYGFVDAFNPQTGWVNADVIGIDVGITLLAAENLRSGNIWRWFMQNREIHQAMRKVGLERYKR